MKLMAILIYFLCIILFAKQENWVFELENSLYSNTFKDYIQYICENCIIILYTERLIYIYCIYILRCACKYD